MESTLNNSALESEAPRPIQIIYPDNHKFIVNLNEFNKIRNSSDIKNRYVVVVSIAGAFRKGKIFC